jgi:hypothetical protein
MGLGCLNTLFLSRFLSFLCTLAFCLLSLFRSAIGSGFQNLSLPEVAVYCFAGFLIFRLPFKSEKHAYISFFLLDKARCGPKRFFCCYASGLSLWKHTYRTKAAQPEVKGGPIETWGAVVCLFTWFAFVFTALSLPISLSLLHRLLGRHPNQLTHIPPGRKRKQKIPERGGHSGGGGSWTLCGDHE